MGEVKGGGRGWSRSVGIIGVESTDEGCVLVEREFEITRKGESQELSPVQVINRERVQFAYSFQQIIYILYHLIYYQYIVNGFKNMKYTAK